MHFLWIYVLIIKKVWELQVQPTQVILYVFPVSLIRSPQAVHLSRLESIFFFFLRCTKKDKEIKIKLSSKINFVLRSSPRKHYFLQSSKESCHCDAVEHGGWGSPPLPFLPQQKSSRAFHWAHLQEAAWQRRVRNTCLYRFPEFPRTFLVIF